MVLNELTISLNDGVTHFFVKFLAVFGDLRMMFEALELEDLRRID